MAFRLSPATRRRVRGALEQKQTGKPTLGQLSGAFAPTHVLPVEMKHRATAERIRATVQAVRRVAQQRGVSTREAGSMLIRTGKQIEQRNLALVQGKARGASAGKTLAALRFKSGIDPALLKVSRNRFVTPEGQFEITAIPGKVLGRRRIRARTAPRQRPTPVATPRR